jgi:hypothetical protein
VVARTGGSYHVLGDVLWPEAECGCGRAGVGGGRGTWDAGEGEQRRGRLERPDVAHRKRKTITANATRAFTTSLMVDCENPHAHAPRLFHPPP